ncbi:MAG: hypothetical protein IJX35_01265, partial [Candidatus Methanomethylophilaceae archaeon]|nr:hypothetical protein [Candidatus Methanomethylophilaceae archaeon]
ISVNGCSAVNINVAANASFDPYSNDLKLNIESSSVDKMTIAQDVSVDFDNITFTTKEIVISGVSDHRTTIANVILNTEKITGSSSELNVDNVTITGKTELGDVDIYVGTGKKLTVDAELGIIASSGSINATGEVIFNNSTPGSNALYVTGNSKGDGWAYDSSGTGKLTLDGYSGSNIFKGTFADLILIGENTITLDASEVALIAIESATLKNISTLATGDGSLSITISGANAKEAIKTGSSPITEFTINGVTIEIDISNDSESVETSTCAIGGNITTLDISFSNVIIVMDNAKDTFCGITAGTIKSFRSAIDIEAPNFGIDATTKLIVAESTITVDAAQGAIKAVASDISNQSKINISSTKGYAFEGAFRITQGSEIVASSMKITDDTTNYATVTNNGNMVIVYDKTFTNNSSFVNNGIVGVYGTFENAVGETVNNGEINTYGYDSKQAVEAKVFGLGENSATIAFAKPVALADGKYSIVLTVTGEETKPYNGTLTYTSDKIIINAVNTSGKISITATLNDAGSVVEKYTVTVTSKNLYVTEKTADGDATYEVTNKNNLYALFDLAKTSVDQFIILTGGKIANNGSFTLNTVQTASQKEFIQAGEFVNAGDLTFNDNVKMAAGKLSGNDVAIGAGVAVELNGDVDAAFVYAGEYTYFDDEAEKDVTVQFDNKVDIIGNYVGVKFSARDGTALEDAAFIS